MTLWWLTCTNNDLFNGLFKCSSYKRKIHLHIAKTNLFFINLPLVSTAKIQKHKYMWAEVSDLLFPSKSYALFRLSLAALQQMMKKKMMSPCHQAPSVNYWRGKKNSSLVSHQSFVLKKEIGTFLLWWCCGNTVWVHWDGLHCWDSHTGSVPTEATWIPPDKWCDIVLHLPGHFSKVYLSQISLNSSQVVL